MIPKISRYSLIAVAIVVLAAILPQVYNTLFDVRINFPYITYSVVTDDFFIMKIEGDKSHFVDTKGNEYSQEEFLTATPVANFFYSLSKGNMPDSVDGVPLIVPQLREERFRLMLRPQRYSKPEYQLYPLFESQPEFGLAFPDDFFRIGNDRIEFITADSNTVNKQKSRLFTTALKEAAFSFPANIVAGIPSPMKSRADGWFITDSSGQLFHLKMEKGKPYVKHIATPEGFEIKAIFATDFRNREFHGMIITRDNKMFLLGIPNYKLIEVPVYDYNPATEWMLLSGSLFNRTVTLISDAEFKSYSLNRDYEIIDTYSEARPMKAEMTVGKVFDYLFPFHINFVTAKSKFIQFNANGFGNLNWIYLNILLLAIAFFLIKWKKLRIANNLLDLAIVAVTGIFGFIAVFMFPNKEF